MNTREICMTQEDVGVSSLCAAESCLGCANNVMSGLCNGETNISLFLKSTSNSQILLMAS